ncbi:uncharacterized protein PHACADRAFT_201768 [Phanerochaete carnosa HHB-10118-sp]|uniref:Uncharacterized protein n=1 Tax=Phanerochaete carnosa (strain HHB-10118-sp) TaxID=650164 RepID=K5VRG5_PHACS|nr:uncharacterized protein PHACADRAFT_201768 [Phanerochaete carnosa HHB-10118-sp]EKM49325.1 hypothetical protein PHACADRAFT_201768 [Phanerochaete carnosa HHB-10118-sp]
MPASLNRSSSPPPLAPVCKKILPRRKIVVPPQQYASSSSSAGAGSSAAVAKTEPITLSLLPSAIVESSTTVVSVESASAATVTGPCVKLEPHPFPMSLPGKKTPSPQRSGSSRAASGWLFKEFCEDLSKKNPYRPSDEEADDTIIVISSDSSDGCRPVRTHHCSHHSWPSEQPSSPTAAPPATSPTADEQTSPPLLAAARSASMEFVDYGIKSEPGSPGIQSGTEGYEPQNDFHITDLGLYLSNWDTMVEEDIKNNAQCELRACNGSDIASKEPPLTRFDKFMETFGIPWHHGKKWTKFYDVLGRWRAALRDIQDRYIAYGYTDAELWASFRLEVANSNRE